MVDDLSEYSQGETDDAHFRSRLPILPWFFRQNLQIWCRDFFSVKGEAQHEDRLVCSDLEVTGRIRDPKSQAWGRRVRFVTADGKTREVDILDRDLAGDMKQVRIKLADAGLWINTESQAQGKFSQLLNNYPADKFITNCSKPGWYKSEGSRIFITPLGEVLGDVTPTDVFALDENGVAPDCEPGGSYEAWQEAAARCVGMDTPHRVRPCASAWPER